MDDEYPDDVYGFDMFCSHANLVPAYLRYECLKVPIEVDIGTYRGVLRIIIIIKP